MAGSGAISVFSSKGLQTLLAALQAVDKDTRKQIRRFTKADASPIWKDEVGPRARTKLEQRVLSATAKVSVSDQNVTLQSGRTGRALSGGARPSEIAAGVEFGALGKRNTYMSTSRRGRRFPVTRRTTNQFGSRNTNGKVVYPASRASIPRLASLWIQTAMRTLADAFDKAH